MQGAERKIRDEGRKAAKKAQKNMKKGTKMFTCACTIHYTKYTMIWADTSIF